MSELTDQTEFAAGCIIGLLNVICLVWFSIQCALTFAIADMLALVRYPCKDCFQSHQVRSTFLLVVEYTFTFHHPCMILEDRYL